MGQVDFFLKIGDIKGESADHKHKDEIDLESFSWGETNAGSMTAGSGGGSGKVAPQDFHFVKKLDKSSPTLFMACATGKHYPDALLTARKAGEKPLEYLKIKMSECLVSSYQVGGSEGSGVMPTEQVSLNFAKIEYVFTTQGPDGSAGPAITQTYDFRKNTKV
jgi:type VI secretion system secreted protein Hcp